MAKLHSYYGLCPIIDQHSLLGISEDIELGHVIVTLGKNISIKYRVADQKQVNSWRTKDKYSSPVLYDQKNEKYVAVFNNYYLRMWDKDEENIDKQKKFKFNISVHTLCSYLRRTFVIFSNGLIYELDAALENRKNIKTEGIVGPEEYVSDFVYTNVDDNIYIGLIATKNERKAFHWIKFAETRESEFCNFELKCENFALVGYMFNKPNNDEEVSLMTLWSNGKLYSYPLIGKAAPPGFQYALIESLSSEHFVTMLALDQNYIAMYGADKNGEGATLIIYNIQFKVVQSRQTFKMFTNHAKIWQIESKLLMCVGQNLAVVPFQLEAEQLAALVGSHKVSNLDKDPDVTIMQELHVETWEAETPQTKKRNIPPRIESKVIELTSQGYTEATICEVLIPEFIEAKGVKAIVSCLKYFCDIPESCIAKVLKFALTADESAFTSLKNEREAVLAPYERRKLLDLILNLPFNDLHIMPFIRKELSISDVILLLKYVLYVLTDDEESVTLQFEKKLLEWSCILFDTNYQQFLLAKDESIVEFLLKFESVVKQLLSYLERIDDEIPRLVNDCKKSETFKHKTCTSYSVEDVALF